MFQALLFSPVERPSMKVQLHGWIQVTPGNFNVGSTIIPISDLHRHDNNIDNVHCTYIVFFPVLSMCRYSFRYHYIWAFRYFFGPFRSFSVSFRSFLVSFRSFSVLSVFIATATATF